MKVYKQLKGEWHWFTELGVAIAMNDLANDMRDVLSRYKQFHWEQKQPKKGKK